MGADRLRDASPLQLRYISRGGSAEDRQRRGRALRSREARSAVATHARSVRDLGQRDHAAADARGDGDPVLGELDGEVPHGDGAREGSARRRARRVGGPRLLLARAQSAPRSAGGERRPAPQRRRAAGGAGHRSLHGGRDRFDRLRRARAARRWQRLARARARVRDRGRYQEHRGREGHVGARRRADDGIAAHGGSRRSEPGPDGARSHDLLADAAALPGLPAREAVRRERDGAPGRATGDARAKEGERPAAPRAHARVARARRRDRPRAAHARRPVRRAVGAAAVGRRDAARRYGGSHGGGSSRPDADSSPIAHHRGARCDAGAP